MRQLGDFRNLKANRFPKLNAGTYLQTPLRLPEFFPIGQWNRFKKTEVRHLTNQLALKLDRNGTKVSLMGAVMLFSLIMQPCVL